MSSFSGNDGCNVLNGTLKIESDKIQFKNISRTLMACEHMADGDVFVNNLTLIDRYEIIGGELFLYQGNLLVMTLESFK